MALLRMDSVKCPEGVDEMVRILHFKESDDGTHTVYTIQVGIGEVVWTVERRYSDFVDFDSQRFDPIRPPKSAKDKLSLRLPPKRLVGNKETNFLHERRAELERYLRSAVAFEISLQQSRRCPTLPRLLARFLHMQIFEIHCICEDLAALFSAQGDWWLSRFVSKPKYVEFSPVELHAVTERLRLAEPTSSSNDFAGVTGGDSKLDLGNLVSFLDQVSNVKIRGASGALGTSNIIKNSVAFSLAPFKHLHALWIADCNAQMISGLANVKRTLRKLTVHYCLKAISDILLEEGEMIEKDISVVQPWCQVENADLSFNHIAEIDQSVVLLRSVARLNLSHNCLTDVGSQLQHLPNLRELDLSCNGLERLDLWHARLGNITRLNLAGNSVRSLQGLCKLYSLEYLDASDNALAHVGDVWAAGALPCLQVLLLSGNPVQSAVEYRTRVLEAFGSRASEVKLDGVRATQRELDTVGVRLAIRKAKEEKERLLENTRIQIGEKLKFLTGSDEALS